MMKHVDINCDMGEVLVSTRENRDHAFMPYISSCNIATGAHAGDVETIRQVMRAAKEHSVFVGMHLAYEDKENFGRKSLGISNEELKASISRQAQLFLNIAAEENVTVTHCKAHGALYNDMISDMSKAEVFLEAIQSVKPDLTIYGLSGSPFIDLVKAKGKRFKNEVFADRRYETAQKLRSRRFDDALITNRLNLLDQLDRFIQLSKVKLIDREEVDIAVDTICIHSDTVAALELLKEMHEYLTSHDIRIIHTL